MDTFSLNKIKKETKESINYIIKFCSERNVTPSMKNFLFFKKEGAFIPDCIYFFMGQAYSKYYFFNSITFYEFYNSLPPDFQKDILAQDEMNTIKRLTLADNDLTGFLSGILKKDFWSSK
jgi:hypothetical protein